MEKKTVYRSREYGKGINIAVQIRREFGIAEEEGRGKIGGNRKDARMKRPFRG